jgi:hypothetical protein
MCLYMSIAMGVLGEISELVFCRHDSSSVRF